MGRPQPPGADHGHFLSFSTFKESLKKKRKVSVDSPYRSAVLTFNGVRLSPPCEATCKGFYAKNKREGEISVKQKVGLKSVI